MLTVGKDLKKTTWKICARYRKTSDLEDFKKNQTKILEINIVPKIYREFNIKLDIAEEKLEKNQMKLSRVYHEKTKKKKKDGKHRKEDSRWKKKKWGVL